MTDLLDEVKADINEEKYHYFTFKVLKLFAICAVVTIIATGIYMWKESSVSALQYRLSMWLNQAFREIEEKKFDDATTHLNQIIEHSHQQYAALAYLNKAAILTKQNKIEEAQNILSEMAEQKHFDIAFRDLARITYLGNQLNNNLPESSQTNEFLDIVTKDERPWQLSGFELKALYKIKHKDFVDARYNLNKILESKHATQESIYTATAILAVISQEK